VGRLAPEKQVSRIREVCGIPGTQVVIVGDGPNRRELEVAFRDHNVVFAGRLTGEELADAYAAMDIFVHCGTEETFGQTIQEAQAAGVAVVAPNRGGPRHLIRDSHTGYLVDSSRWGAFREKVLHLLEHPEERNRMSRNAREAVKGKTWQKNNEELLAYYSQARDTMQTREPLAA
jgi:phosphatidylinositol alpha 1,6-mannosyltransferase